MDINKEIVVLTLQSKKTYFRLLELNCEDGSCRETTRRAIDGKFLPIKINGVFDFLSEILVALYVSNGAIFLKIGNIVIQIVNGVTVVLDRDKMASTLTVVHGSRVLASLSYVCSVDEKIKDDPTPFIEDEDFDFGLFLKNVISSRERIKVLQENW
ncbi:hypothetical protein ACO0LB_20320 [Undibacterium sp. SXout7W]|uniref:hypothetical protein n=1 Tax=Undibacterium sp. SXout7W TaxID=3413049 RepID=UPI003BF2BA25